MIVKYDIARVTFANENEAAGEKKASFARRASAASPMESRLSPKERIILTCAR